LKNSNYTILEEPKLVIQVYRHFIAFEESIALKEEIFRDHRYTSDHHFLLDIRDVTDFHYNKSHINAFLAYLNRKIKGSTRNKTAVLTDNPDQVVKTMLFSFLSSKSLFQYEPFTTVAAALYYLNIDIKYEAKVNLAIKITQKQIG